MAANFDFLENIAELQPLYAHCRETENFQLVRPEQSVIGARKALEYWVKLVYLTNGWDMPQHAGLMELVSNTRLTALVHYVNTIHEVIIA